MTNPIDTLYSATLNMIMYAGTEIQTRNSVCKRSRNVMLTFDKTPLVCVRKTAWKNALREMEWFMSGSSHIDDLHPAVRHWWEPWAKPFGEVRNNYSKQFRQFHGHANTVNQIGYLMHAIKKHPYSRRSVITTWNTADMTHPLTPITNCHGTVIQAFVDPDDSLHMTMYQRSSDMVLGWQHNLIQYWALMMYLAHYGNRKPGSFTWVGGDCHIYEDHYKVANKIIATKGLDNVPNLVYNPSSLEFRADDFTLDGDYKPIITDKVRMIV